MLANQVFAKKCRRCSPLPRLLSWCLTVRLKPNTRVEYSLLKVCGISAAWAAWLNAAYRGVKMIKSAKARFQGIKIGRASCRERVYNSVVVVLVKERHDSSAIVLSM